jgi:hypothetical protein
LKRLLFGGLNPSKAGWPTTDPTVTKLCGFTARITLVDFARFATEDGDVFKVVDGGAVFSGDYAYRYRLWRVLARHGVAFARFDIVNLYGLIATHQRDLWEHVNPVSHDGLGAENDRHVRDAVSEADMVIAAWGGLPRRPAVWQREKEVLETLSGRHDVYCLGKTADGEPRHPSRLAYATPLELFRERRDRVAPSDRRAADFVKKSIEGGFASLEDFT